MTPWPPVGDVLPHAGRAVLLARIVEHTDERTACAVEITEPLVPGWVALEYMAQCIAAHAGLRARTRGEPVKVGLLVGARRVDVRASGFRRGQALIVTAERVWGEREVGAFACTVRDAVEGAVLVEGTLNAVLPGTLDALLERPAG